MAISSQDYTA